MVGFFCALPLLPICLKKNLQIWQICNDLLDTYLYNRSQKCLYIFAIPVPNGVRSDILPAIYRHKGMILRLFLPGIRLSS